MLRVKCHRVGRCGMWEAWGREETRGNWREESADQLSLVLLIESTVDSRGADGGKVESRPARHSSRYSRLSLLWEGRHHGHHWPLSPLNRLSGLVLLGFRFTLPCDIPAGGNSSLLCRCGGDA